MPLECRYRKMPMQPYLRATLADQDRIAGRDMFETFPDNPGVSDIDRFLTPSAFRLSKTRCNRPGAAEPFFCPYWSTPGHRVAKHLGWPGLTSWTAVSGATIALSRRARFCDPGLVLHNVGDASLAPHPCFQRAEPRPSSPRLHWALRHVSTVAAVFNPPDVGAAHRLAMAVASQKGAISRCGAWSRRRQSLAAQANWRLPERL